MGNVAKVAMVLRQGDINTDGWVEMVVTWHVQSLDSRPAYDEDDLTAIGVAAFDWWTQNGPYGTALMLSTALSACYTEYVWLVRVEVFRVEPDAELAVTVPGENWTGTFLTAELGAFTAEARQYPPQVCWMIRLDTAEESRSTRGRLYLPATEMHTTFGPTEQPEQWVSSFGLIHVDIRNHLGAMAQNLGYFMRWALGIEFECVLAVYSRKNGASRAVTGFQVSNFYRTQRRRAVMPATSTEYDLVPPP